MNGEGSVSYSRRIERRLMTLLALETQIVMELKMKYDIVQVKMIIMKVMMMIVTIVVVMIMMMPMMMMLEVLMM